jgi:hypothetical protein
LAPGAKEEEGKGYDPITEQRSSLGPFSANPRAHQQDPLPHYFLCICRQLIFFCRPAVSTRSDR